MAPPSGERRNIAGRRSRGTALASCSPPRTPVSPGSVRSWSRITPARVVASIAAGLTSRDQIVLFDYPDVTSLYSQFRQGRANTERTTKNLERIKDMFANQAATARDLNEAETEATNARASMAESEAKLRALGFNPIEFGSVTSATAWLMSDVPESQLPEVQKGEDVDIVFSSFPDTKIQGRAEAIGEVVDPVTRTVRVRVSTPNPQGRILPGMFARIDFGDPVSGVFVLPNAAVVTVEGADYVFVQVDGITFERRRITVGSSGTTEVVVLKGLREGELVVVEGAMLLKGLSFGY
jgi:cobalt-zinc-cadmium efflux system membrane fusion protein